MAEEQRAMTNVLRWIAVLPASIIAMILSMFPLHLVLYQTLTGSGLIEPYPEMPERLLGPLAATLAFVWVGSRIAPRRKVETAVVLFGATLLLSGAAIALGYSGARAGSQQFYIRIGGIPAIAGIVGAFIGLYLVRRQNSESENSKIPE
jgi:hypothetical protein